MSRYSIRIICLSIVEKDGLFDLVEEVSAVSEYVRVCARARRVCVGGGVCVCVWEEVCVYAWHT